MPLSFWAVPELFFSEENQFRQDRFDFLVVFSFLASDVLFPKEREFLQ